ERLPMILDVSGSVPMSTIETVSLPGAITRRVFVSSHRNFSSLPTIISCAELGEIHRATPIKTRTTDDLGPNGLMGSDCIRQGRDRQATLNTRARYRPGRNSGFELDKLEVAHLWRSGCGAPPMLLA